MQCLIRSYDLLDGQCLSYLEFGCAEGHIHLSKLSDKYFTVLALSACIVLLGVRVRSGIRHIKS